MDRSTPIKWDQEAKRLAILVSGKIYFKLKLIRIDKEHFILIKGKFTKKTLLSKTYMYKILCALFHRMFMSGIKDTDQSQYINNRWFQHSMFSNRQIIWGKYKQRNILILDLFLNKWHYLSNGLNRYQQNIPPKHQSIYILLSSKWKLKTTNDKKKSRPKWIHIGFYQAFQRICNQSLHYSKIEILPNYFYEACIILTI